MPSSFYSPSRASRPSNGRTQKFPKENERMMRERKKKKHEKGNETNNTRELKKKWCVCVCAGGGARRRRRLGATGLGRNHEHTSHTGAKRESSVAAAALLSRCPWAHIPSQDVFQSKAAKRATHTHTLILIGYARQDKRNLFI